MDRPASSEPEIEAVWVELEVADELAIGGHEVDIVAGHQEVDLAVAMADADPYVSEPAQVAEGYAAVVVDLVLSDR